MAQSVPPRRSCLAGAHQGTPYIVPEDRACNMCLECVKTCPTGALEGVEKKEEIRMGVAVVDKRLCLPWIPNGVCGACHTVCPLKNRAVTVGIRIARV